MDEKMILDVIPTQIELPNEILIKIFEFLPKRDHHIVGLVSKRFQTIIDSIRFEKQLMVTITEENLQEIKCSIENQSCKLNFERVEIKNVTSIDDFEFILRAIGKRIKRLSLDNTAALKILKRYVMNLKYLKLYFDNGLSQALSGENKFDLNAFPFLEKLSFTGNESLQDEANVLFRQLQTPETSLSLKHFKLNCIVSSDNYLNNALLSHKNTLETLHLNFINNCGSAQWYSLWSSLNNLKNLRLAGNVFFEIVNMCFTTLSKQNKLEKLYLFKIRDTLLTLIVEKWMDSLIHLELSVCTDLTDCGVMELRKLTKLRFLKLAECDKITNMGLLMGIAVENNLRMEELHLENIPKLDEFGLRVMVSRFPNLRVLKITKIGAAVTNTALASIFRFLTRLRNLSIDYGVNITDEGLIGFGSNPSSIKRLRLLEELTLNHCRNLTDQTLINALHLPKLWTLELGKCHKITLKGIQSMVEKCPSLEVLSLPSAALIDDKALFVIGNGLKYLRQLSITGCAFIPENVRDNIKDVFNALKDPTSSTLDSNCVLNMKM